MAKSDRNKPRYAKHKDQHGRLWDMFVEKATNHPCTTPSPAGWSAPWLPPTEYVKVFDEDDQTVLRIDYDALIDEYVRADHEWEQNIRKVGLSRHKEESDPANPSPTVLMIVGPRPRSAEPAIMAKRGDPWILGDPTAKKPAWADKFFAPKKSAEDEIYERLKRTERAVVPDAKPQRQSA